MRLHQTIPFKKNKVSIREGIFDNIKGAQTEILCLGFFVTQNIYHNLSVTEDPAGYCIIAKTTLPGIFC